MAREISAHWGPQGLVLSSGELGWEHVSLIKWWEDLRLRAKERIE